MQMAVILQPNIQGKLSSHGLSLSNAYSETILFDFINSEEKLFDIINWELGTDANVQNRNALQEKWALCSIPVSVYG